MLTDRRGSGGSGPLGAIKLIDVGAQNLLDVRSDNRIRSAILLIGAGGLQGAAPLDCSNQSIMDQIIDPTWSIK